ncbi:MAG: hypothetical protein FWC62_04710 [Firmicutes bacterium]|nr:hypothetical protein [Bacillota bacterium]
MRDFITKTLDGIRDLDEKTILKDALNDVFWELYTETERKYALLEERVRAELPLVYEPYTICSTVLRRTQVDNGHPYLSPMIPSESESLNVNVGKLADALAENEQPVIGTVFYEADYLKCRRVDLDHQIFDGVFRIGGEQYPFKCRLKPAKRYMDLVANLYGMFLQNNVPWTTVNCAYLNKFFDISLIDLPTIPPYKEISGEQIHITFLPYGDAIKRDFIPVWNIDRHRVKGDDFPMPALDKVNYEYRFHTNKLSVENGFLVDYDSAYIQSSRREEGIVVAVSPVQRGLTWDMLRIRRRQDRPVDTYPYVVLSNKQDDCFSTRLTAASGVQVKTKAELRKLLSSFESAKSVEPESMNLVNDKISGETYSMNPFIMDELRDPEFQRTLALGFRAKNRNDFLSRDLVSFLVSQAQLVYSEYNCVGTLL